MAAIAGTKPLIRYPAVEVGSGGASGPKLGFVSFNAAKFECGANSVGLCRDFCERTRNLAPIRAVKESNAAYLNDNVGSGEGNSAVTELFSLSY